MKGSCCSFRNSESFFSSLGDGEAIELGELIELKRKDSKNEWEYMDVEVNSGRDAVQNNKFGYLTERYKELLI